MLPKSVSGRAYFSSAIPSFFRDQTMLGRPSQFISEIIAARTLTVSGEVMNTIGVPNDDLTPAYSSDQLRRRI